MNKKAQGSLELVLILVFVFALIGGIMYIIGLKSVEYQDIDKKKELDDFAKSITHEFEILVKVEEGYRREVEIPDFIIKKFNVTLNGSYLVLRSMDRDDINADPNFYFIPKGVEPSLIIRNISGINKTFLLVEKEDYGEFDSFLVLS
ncbi:MAG: hypothetical protein KC589_10660 [Nanoarchaeota archaeon]|nr:hypothetical protein [Nanoarchaeota archaeon]